MSVFDGLRLYFLPFLEEEKGKIRVLNYRRIVLLLRFLTVELHKKIS